MAGSSSNMSSHLACTSASCTGSRGERGQALEQALAVQAPGLVLLEGDVLHHRMRSPSAAPRAARNSRIGR